MLVVGQCTCQAAHLPVFLTGLTFTRAAGICQYWRWVPCHGEESQVEWGCCRLGLWEPSLWIGVVQMAVRVCSDWCGMCLSSGNGIGSRYPVHLKGSEAGAPLIAWLLLCLKFSIYLDVCLGLNKCLCQSLKGIWKKHIKLLCLQVDFQVVVRHLILVLEK